MGIEFFFSIFLLFYLSRKSVTRFSKTIYGSKVQNYDDDAHCAKTFQMALNFDSRVILSFRSPFSTL